MNIDYIEPYLRGYNSLNELQQGNNPYYSIRLDDKLGIENKNNHVLIVAEPGYGKTRFLKELVVKHEVLGRKCLWLDLKSIGSNVQIDAHIRQEMQNKTTEQIKLFDRIQIYWSKDFVLENHQDIVICLDALDEVGQNHIISLIDNLTKFQKDFSQAKIIISSRTHHLIREAEYTQISNWTNEVIAIAPFGPDQIVAYLKNKCPKLQDLSKKDISNKLDIILPETSFFRDDYGILSIPRYLELYSELYNDKGDIVFSKSKCDIFDLMINKRLKIEATQKGNDNFNNDRYYVKAILEKLALIMEIQRVNILPKSDFASFLMDTQLNIDSAIRHQILFDRTILKDNRDSLEFDNTEFQEYLAAKALLGLGKVEQSIFDIAMDNYHKWVYNSWYAVLGFIIELKPIFLFNLLNHGLKVKDKKRFQIIQYGTQQFYNDNKEQFHKLYESIIAYYYNHREKIDYETEKAIIPFFDFESHHKILEEKAESDNKDFIQNTIYLILHQTNKISSKKYPFWKEKIKKWALSEDFEIAKDAIYAIYNMDKSIFSINDCINIFEEIKQLNSEEDANLSNLLKAMAEINSNDLNFIRLSCKFFFIDSPHSSPINHQYEVFEKINSKEGFQKLFEIIIQLEELTYFNRLDSYFNDNFFKNLENNWDEQTAKYALMIIEKAYLNLSLNQQFLKNLGAIIKKKYPDDYLKYLLDLFFKDINLIQISSQSHQLAYFFYAILEEKNLEEGILYINKYLNKDEFSYEILYMVSYHDKSLKAKELLNKYYKEKIYVKTIKENEQQKGLQKLNHQIQQEKEIKFNNDLRIYLNCLENKHFHTISEYERFKDNLTEQHKQQLKGVLIDIFTSIEPLEAKIVWKTENRWTMSLDICQLTKATNLAKEFEIDLQPLREKIIQLALIKPYEHKLIAFISPLAQDEIDNIVQFYKANKDKIDKNNFIEMVNNHNHTQFLPIIDEIVKDFEINQAIREGAIELCYKLGKKEAYFQDLLKTSYTDELLDKHEIVIVILHRQLLNFQNADAFDWLVNHAFESNKSSIFEHLKAAEDIKFTNKFVELLEKMVEYLINESPENKKGFAKDVWDATSRYFIRIKDYRELHKSNIEAIKKVCENYENKWFVEQFKADNLYLIEEKYREKYNEPSLFSDAIKDFIKLKEKKYLPIAYIGELESLVFDVLDKDLRAWIKYEGGENIIHSFKKENDEKREQKENRIQKQLITQIERLLLKREIRTKDFNIHREAESGKALKVDFIISYGTIGNILIELKLINNSELNESKLEDYTKNTIVKEYMEPFACKYGILLVLRTTKKEGSDLKCMLLN